MVSIVARFLFHADSSTAFRWTTHRSDMAGLSITWSGSRNAAKGFSLVPWKPVIEQRLGQQLAVTIRGRGVSWGIGPRRGISMG